LVRDTLPSALPNARAGRLRALTVTAAQPSPIWPDLPTITEAGVPGDEATSWFDLCGGAYPPARRGSHHHDARRIRRHCAPRDRQRGAVVRASGARAG
jgi:hypothetical protein